MSKNNKGYNKKRTRNNFEENSIESNNQQCPPSKKQRIGNSKHNNNKNKNKNDNYDEDNDIEILNNNVNEYKNYIKKLDANNLALTKIDFSDIKLTDRQLKELAISINKNHIVGNIKWHTNQKRGDLIDFIENKIITNNKDYKYYPSDFVYCLLSKHSYDNVKKGSPVQFKEDDYGYKYNTYLTNWKVNIVITVNDSSYYGVLYENEVMNQLVLAHRGTVFKLKPFTTNTGWVNDFKGILSGNLVDQQLGAYTATIISTKVANEKNYSLSTTGHSLGGWIAELSLFFSNHYLDPKKTLVKLNKAVTFDSPGSVFNIEKLKSHIESQDTKCDITNLDSKTYLSYPPNLVNSCNVHFGTVLIIYPDIKNCDYYKKYGSMCNYNMQLFSICNHFIDLILDTFDPKSGKPKKVNKALNWPLIKRDVDIDKNVIIKEINNYTNALVNAGIVMCGIKLINPANIISATVVNIVSKVLSKGVIRVMLPKAENKEIIQFLDVALKAFKGKIDFSQCVNAIKLSYKELLVEGKEFDEKYKRNIHIKEITPYLEQYIDTGPNSLRNMLENLLNSEDKFIQRQLSEFNDLFSTHTNGGKVFITGLIPIELIKNWVKRLREIDSTELHRPKGGYATIYEKTHDDVYKNLRNKHEKKLIQSLKEIQSKHPEQWKLMKYLAYVNPDFIDIKILQYILDKRDFINSILFINKLKKACLIDFVIKDTHCGIKIDKFLQQEIITKHVKNADRENLLKGLGKLTKLLFETKENVKEAELLATTVEEVLSKINEQSKEAELLATTVEEALNKINEQSIALHKHKLYHNLANYYYKTNSDFSDYNFNQILRFYQDSYHSIYTFKKQTHKITLANKLFECGNDYYNKQYYKKSLILFEQAYLIYKNIFCNDGNLPNDSNFGDIANNIAVTYGKLNNNIKYSGYMRQAYWAYIECKCDEKAGKLLKHVNANSKKHDFIPQKTIVSQEILLVEEKIYYTVIEQAYNKTLELKWSQFGHNDWKNCVMVCFANLLTGQLGVKRYLAEGFIEEKLDDLNSKDNVVIAKNLVIQSIFFAIDKITKSKDSESYENHVNNVKENGKEFIKNYKDPLRRLIDNNPEYFVNKSILDACKELVNPQIELDNDETNLSGNDDTSSLCLI